MTPMGKAERPDGQDDVDVIFGEIVADLRAEGLGTGSDSAASPSESAEPSDSSKPSDPAPDSVGGGWRPGMREWDETMLGDDSDDDEHFVPPDPPPLPKPPGSVLVTGLFFLLGFVLLIAPSFLGLTLDIGMPLGILAMAAGIGFLLLHARDDPRPPGSDPENGAQV